jgi:aquaporin rerated protein, other eukaryote
MFLFMGFGGAHTANLPAAAPTGSGQGFIDTSNLLFISLTFGMSLIINVWIFFRISGALFNPAIALALAVTGVMPPLRAALLVIAQILGGITAAGLIHGLMPGPLNVSTTLADGVSIPQGRSPQIHY